MVTWNAVLGQTLAYEGGSAGYFNAMNAQTGAIVWSDPFGAAITSSPLVEGSSVWIAPADTDRVYKLDAATGAIECSAAVDGSVLATPVVATPPGDTTTVYYAALGSGSVDGAVYAFDESDCSRDFTWDGYTIKGQDTGVWDQLSYALDATGEPLVVFGSANPDSSVYALDAKTGALVWTFDTENPAGEDWDVGSGVDLTAPGVNGFADGAAYFDGKNGQVYALNLTTGAKLWSNDFGKGANTDSLSTPAVSGSTLVFGDNTGVYAFNTITGKLLWHYQDGNDDVNSSPAIVGPAGDQVVAFGTLGGVFDVLNLQTGAVLYSYKTGGYITSSPADVDGNLLIDSADGYLYDFRLEGGNGTAPTTSVTSPATGATLPSPATKLVIKGTANAPHGVAAVRLEIQENGTSGPWYHWAAKSFSPGLDFGDAKLAIPGAATTTWSIRIPVPAEGGAFMVEASTVDTDGIADNSSGTGQPGPAVSSFTVSASTTAPVITSSVARSAPGQMIDLSATGFSPDELVRFTLPLSSNSNVSLATATADGSGDVGPTTATVPTSAPFGPVTITGTGKASGRVGDAQVYISNNSPELGYSATRSEFEPNDMVLEHYQAVSSKTFFEPAWSFSAAGAIDSTPAFADGTAYVGDESGLFYALELGHRCAGVARRYWQWNRVVPRGRRQSRLFRR